MSEQQPQRKDIEELRHLADQGDDDATYNLGLRYHIGDGVEQDFIKAKQYYERAAKHNHPNALCNLGIMYSQGHGVDPDVQLGALLIRQAADQGQPNAQLTIAGMYFNGEGVEQDYVKAFQYYELADLNGLSDAKISMGYMYLDGVGVKKDEQRAAELFEQMAARGNTPAQFLVGKRAFQGRGTDDGQPDYERAAYWLTKAADGGDAEAMVMMSTMYMEGSGVEQNDHKAIVMLGRAALAGDNNALAQLVEYNHFLNGNLASLERDAPLTVTFSDERRINYINMMKSLSSLQQTVMKVAQKLEDAGIVNIDRSDKPSPQELH